MEHSGTDRSVIEMLRCHPLTRDLQPCVLEHLVGCAEASTFAPGEFLSRQGESANRLYLICSGQATLEILVPHQGPLQIDTIGAGEVSGCAFLVPGRLWHFDARALTEIHAVRIDGVRLWEKCEQDPSLGYALVKCLAAVSVNRLDATRLRLLDLYAPGLRPKS